MRVAGFLYFTPRIGGIGQFVAAGLDYAFAASPAMTEVGAALGPQNLPGIVYHDGAEGIPSAIRWQLVAPFWWIGHNSARAPGPNDLLREDTQISLGYGVTLGDKNTWQIPVVIPCVQRDPHRRCGLPMVYRTAAGGELPETAKVPGFLLSNNQIKLEVSSAYTDLVRQAVKFSNALDRAMDEDSVPPMTEHETLNFCVGCLSVRYRVRIHECMMLGLFTPQTVNDIVFAAVDTEERMTAKLNAMANAEAQA